MSFDYSKLSGRIVEKFKTRKAFAQAVGFTQETISKKLSGNMAISVKDINDWSAPNILDIKAEEIPEYFFKQKVQGN